MREDIAAKSCGQCLHWDRENKRNVSTPLEPLYYSECKFPIDELKIPHCVMFEETSENNGVGCPCFESDSKPSALTGL